MRRNLMLLFTAVILLIGGRLAAQEGCTGAPPPRLKVGQQAVVTPGQANNVRQNPTPKAALLGKIQPGEVVTILDGPVCADGYNWWQVKFNRFTGWTPEGKGQAYWLSHEGLPTPMPTQQPVATVVQDTITASFQGVTFTLDKTLATAVTGEVMAENRVNGPSGVWPQGILFRFKDFSSDERRAYQKSFLRVYPADDFGKVDPSGAKTIAGLAQFLQDQPTNPKRIPTPTLGGSAQVIRAQVKYLTFDGGVSVRFVTTYAQDMVIIANDRLLYQFVGLLNGGKTYVLASFSLAAAGLPETVDYQTLDYDELARKYLSYLAETTDQLNKLTTDQYKPKLDLLDALVLSIKVK
jgi:hypothetical protein